MKTDTDLRFSIVSMFWNRARLSPKDPDLPQPSMGFSTHPALSLSILAGGGDMSRAEKR